MDDPGLLRVQPPDRRSPTRHSPSSLQEDYSLCLCQDHGSRIRRPLANFCVFRNQSSGSFSVQLNRGINNSGIYGIQIVPTDPTNQDLIDNVGATVEDAIPLGVLGDRDTSVGFSTLKSSIDTEIAIFTPLGTLAQENDDIGGTSQSVIGARGLLPGTWYLAVGEYDTSFADGFEVTGGASGSVLPQCCPLR